MVILGLGSNIGDRLANLAAAAARLSGVLSHIQCSRIYESAAMLPEGAPADWDMPYYNMAIRGDTTLTVKQLFDAIKTIERDLGRTAGACWSPRVIDIDILAMDDLLLDSDELHIPHRGLLDRDFALLPFAELSADWHYPRPGEYYGQMAQAIAKKKSYTLGGYLKDTGLTLNAQH